MHLNNDQLLEPGDKDLQHLSHCQLCQSRMNNLGLLRKQLQSIPEASADTDQWWDIQQGYQARATVSQLDSARKSTHFWRLASAAIAASFALFLVWQSNWFTPKPSEELYDASFAALIDENSALQSQLNVRLSSSQELNARAAGLLVELEIINTKLQQAYLKKDSRMKKHALWQRRQALLKSTLEAFNKQHVIKV